MTKQNRSFFDYLGDEDERPFLLAAMNCKLDDAARGEYVELLEVKDPIRAEWLRLGVELHQHATDDTSVHQRLAALGRQINYDFKRVFDHENIINCGNAKNEKPRVRFSLVCDKRWETLLPTEEDSVRHCNECQTQVHYCHTVREAEAHARAGNCIAVPILLTDQAAGGNYRNAVGRPDPIGDWGDRLFPND